MEQLSANIAHDGPAWPGENKVVPALRDAAYSVAQRMGSDKVRPFVRDAGCGMRGTGCGIRDTGCGMRDAGCGIRDAGCGMRDAGCGMRDAGCGIIKLVYSLFFVKDYFAIPLLMPGQSTKCRESRIENFFIFFDVKVIKNTFISNINHLFINPVLSLCGDISGII
jgi:hypothetical protein